MTDDVKNNIEENKALCAMYPYLIPRNVWTDHIPEDYDYSWTLLDDVCFGWRKLFLQVCEDIRSPLIDACFLNNFRFITIKEKWGTLRMYHNGAPEEVNNIINKYEYMSQFVCIKCGSTEAQEYDDGWISPYCKKCFGEKHNNKTKKELKQYICGEKFKPTFIITTYCKGKKTKEKINVTNEWRRLNNG